MQGWSRAVLPALVLALGLFATDCGSSSNASSSESDGAIADAFPDDGGFGVSTCGQCVAAACQAQVATCKADPDCATYLGCEDICPPTSAGGPDPACVATCPHGSSSAGKVVEAQLDDCRLSGAGAMCAACGIDGGGQNPLVHQTCSLTTGQAACATCENDECCDTYAACLANPGCVALEGCLGDCVRGAGDDAGSPAGGAPDGGSCQAICGQAHPSGLDDWARRETCLLAKCAVVCESPPMPPLSSCLACQYQSCADPFASLDGTSDGYLFAACIATCSAGDSACSQGCVNQYPNAQAASFALVTCLTANCPACD